MKNTLLETNQLNYLDGNAVTFLWDSYTNFKNEGKQGDDVSLTPFKNTIFSEYSLDELITIPINNVYKKHLDLLTIFQDLPVFKSIGKFSKNNLNGAAYSDLLMPQDYTRNVMMKRTFTLFFPEHFKDLERDIQNKENGKLIAANLLKKDESGSVIYVPLKNRISIKNVINKIVTENKLDPINFPYDFYLLCMGLYHAVRDRLLQNSKEYAKKPTQMLNQQIDFYHLSYLPFVEKIVTSDKYLAKVGKEIISYFNLNKKVQTAEEFWSEWLQNLLLGKK